MLEVVGLSKSYRSGAKVTHAIERLDFAVEEHEFVGIVGPSGAGKTTLLKCIAGLLAPTSGQTLLRGNVVTAPPPELAVVFQDYSRSLFPWLTVRRNVELPLRHKGVADKGGAASRRSPPSASPASRATTRGSCRAACSSASRSRGRSPTSRRCC